MQLDQPLHIAIHFCSSVHSVQCQGRQRKKHMVSTWAQGRYLAHHPRGAAAHEIPQVRGVTAAPPQELPAPLATTASASLVVPMGPAAWLKHAWSRRTRKP